MLELKKNWIRSKINAYFLFIALAFGLSAYLLMVDGASQHQNKINILVSPKNVKTALRLDKIKQSILVMAEKNNLLDEKSTVKTDKETDLIEIQATAKSPLAAANLSEETTREVLTLASKHYDIKKDLLFEIVARESQTKKANSILILGASILIGLVLSFGVQILLDVVEKIILFSISRKKIYTKQKTRATMDLDNFFKLNREKIQKLSLPLSSASKKRKNEIFQSPFGKHKASPKIKTEAFTQYQPNFKKAASPANLPIAEEDLNKIAQVEMGELSENYIQKDLYEKELASVEPQNIFPDVKAPSDAPEETLPVDELREAFGEPTEEEFKKRLNQLLGNKF